MMYSINELILSGCWKLGENTTHNKQSCPMDMRSEICVKRENAQPFLNSTDHQVAMGLLPIESSLQADLLSNTDRSLPEDFYEELVDPPIDQPPWVGIGKQPDKQVKKEIFSPAQITSRNRDDVLGQVTSSSTIPLYGWTTQMQVPTFQMKSFQDGPTPTVYQPIPTYENGSSSPEYHPDWLQVSKPPENNIVVTNRTCPVKNCQCICHERPQNVSPHLSSFHDEEQQRPGVIMVPVSHKETAVSVVTHVPLQMTTTGHLSKPLEIPVQQFVRNRVIVDDSDSEKEENYFQMATHKTKARFKLSKTDWVKIPIKRFPSGGRLLGGQWTQIFSSKVKPSNPWCSLRFKNNHVRSENSRKMHSAPFFRGAAECKRPECAVKLQFVIQEEKGKYVDVMCIGNVSHKISD